MHHRAKMLAAVLLGGILVLGGGAGCAGRKTKTVQTVSVEDAAPSPGDEARAPREPKKTTTTTTEEDEGSPGIVGSAFGLVWAVIAFPFRVIGALF